MVDLYGERGAMERYMIDGYSTLEDNFKVDKPQSPIARETSMRLINTAFIDKLKKAFPRVAINEDFYNDPRAGWIEEGIVNINLSKATQSTYFHEYGHILLYLMGKSMPDLVRSMKDSVYSTPEFEEAAVRYSELGVEAVIEEALMLRLEKVSEYGIADKVMLRLFDAIATMLKRLGIPTIGYLSTVKLDAALLSMEEGLISGTYDIDSDSLAKAFKESKDSRVEVEGTMDGLLNHISGRTVSHTLKSIRSRMLDIMANPELRLMDKSGQVVGVFLSKQDKANASKPGGNPVVMFDSPDAKAREEQVMEVLKKAYTVKVEKSIKDIIKVYGGDVEGIDKALLKKYMKLWPSHQKSDMVVLYTDLKDIQLYSKYYMEEFDTGNILVKIRPGKEPVFEMVMVTSESLEEPARASRLVGNLALKSRLLPEVLNTRLFGLSKNIGQSASFKNLALLHLTCMNSAMRKVDGDVRIRSMKVSRPHINTDWFQIMDLHLTEGTQLAKKVLGLPQVSDHLKDTKLYDKLYEDGKANKNLENLSYNLIAELTSMSYTQSEEEAEPFNLGNLNRLASNYMGSTDADRIPNTLDLIKEIESVFWRMEKYKAQDIADMGTNAVTLMEAWHQLQMGVKQDVNPYKQAGFIESYASTAKTQSNPYIAWWYKGWHQAKFNMREKFELYLKERSSKFEKLKSSVNTGMRQVTTRVIDVQSDYYKHLLQTVNGKVVPIFKPDTELSESDREFVSYYKSKIKEAAKESFRLSSSKKAKVDPDFDASFEAWYGGTVWSRGHIPIVSAKVSTRMFEGDLAGTAKLMMERMVDTNPFYEYEQSTSMDELPDYMMIQAVESSWDDRLAKLDGYAELDLRKVLDMYVLHSYKMDEYNKLIPLKKAASHLIKMKGINYGIVGADGVTRDEEVLEALFNYLVFNKRSGLASGDDTVARYIKSMAEFTSTLTTYAAIGVSPFTDLKTFSQSMVRIAATGLAQTAQGEKYSLKDLNATWWSFLTSPGKEFMKAIEIGTKLGLINADTADYMTNRWKTDEQLSMLDVRNAFLIPRFADNFIKAFLLATMMRRDRTWEAWDYDGKTLTYNKEKDREARKAVVDMVEFNHAIETRGKELDTTHDALMRITYEKRIADILGGYSEGETTRLGTTVLGGSFMKFRTYQLNRIIKAIRGEETNELEADYGVDADGNPIVLNQLDTGMIRSFATSFATLTQFMEGNTDFNHLSTEDKANLYKASSYMLTGGIIFFAQLMLGLEDDDEDERLFFRLTEAIITDMLIHDQMIAALGMVKSPFAGVFYSYQLGITMMDYIKGDVVKANHQLVKQVGILRSADLLMELGKQ